MNWLDIEERQSFKCVLVKNNKAAENLIFPRLARVCSIALCIADSGLSRSTGLQPVFTLMLQNCKTRPNFLLPSLVLCSDKN